MSDISELPLKPNKQTFVDVPKSLDAVVVDELVHELVQRLKDINKIHVFEALRVFSQLLQDIILLQSNQELLQQYRSQLLGKYAININEIPLPSNSMVDIALESTDSVDKVDDIKLDILSNDVLNDNEDESILEKIKDRVERTFSNNFEELDGFQPISFDAVVNDDMGSLLSDDEDIPIKLKRKKVNPSHGDVNPPLTLNDTPDPEYIDVAHLIKNTDLSPVASPISDISPERIKKDVLKRRSFNQTNQLLKVFNLVNIPSLSIDDFLLRLNTYSSSISTSCYIHAALMIFKLTLLFDRVPLSLHNVHRFILASVRCSTKTLEDIYQKQKTFATVGGVSLKDLFKIEVGFLYLIDFRLVTGENMLNEFLIDEFVQLRHFINEHFKS